MITVSLRGGLGNQMFQYAAGLAVAHKNTVPLVLDTVFLNDRFPRKNFVYRSFDLDIFNISGTVSPLSNLSTTMPLPGIWLMLDLISVAARDVLGSQRLIKEKKELSFDPEVFNAGSNVFLWGFWQTPNYFQGIEGMLREAFRFKYALGGLAAEIGEDIKANNSISLHVRRTDFITPRGEIINGKTDLAYYNQAVNFIAAKVENPKFYLFSDDIEWCKKNIKIGFPVEYLERSSEGPKASHHLQLMSLCKHNIITNSTFSWWGAWLNQNPTKHVVAPAIWRVGRGPGDDDIVPAGWERI